MIGFCKCDICGNMYHKDENKNYDGIMVWYFDEDGDIMTGKRKYNITGRDGEVMKDIPEMLDVCPNCFERFYNWIKMNRDENFQINKPE